MEIKEVIAGLFSYLEPNMVPGMSDLQEVLFYTAQEALYDEADTVINFFKQNPVFRALIAIDKDGNIDVNRLAKRIRKGIERKGQLSFNIPLYGPVKFVPEDIDNIVSLITMEEVK